MDQEFKPSGSALAITASKVRSIATPISKTTTFIGGIILFLLMLLTTINVILRYGFGRPIPWAFEMSEMMIALICSLGFPMAATLKINTRVTILTDRLSESAHRNLCTIVDLVAFFMVVLMSWQAFEHGLALKATNQMTSYLEVPKFFFLFVLSFGFGVTALVLFHDFLSSLADMLENNNRRAVTSGMIIGLIVLFLFSIPMWGAYIAEGPPALMIGIIGLIVSLALIFARMTVGLALAIIGFLGLAYLRSVEPALGMVGRIPYSNIVNYNLSTMPLFILMGLFGMASGIVDDLFDTLYKWLGNLKGGVAIATIGVCAFFGAISGAAAAAAATMAKIAYPQMKRFNYADSLALSSIAAGGPLANLIPPSMGFIIYGLMTETSIGKLFIAGMVPGVINAILFMGAVWIRCIINPALGPAGGKTPWKEKLTSIKGSGPIIFFFLFIIGGIYMGAFTPVEAGGVGAFGIMVFVIVRRRFSFRGLRESLIESVATTVMIFLIFIGAMFLSYFLAQTGIPHALEAFVKSLPVSRSIIILAISLIYLIMGCFMETLSMMLFTIPVFFPIVMSLGYDPVWYGVMMVLLSDLGMITPPMGMVVFILSGVTRVPTFTIFRGILPFVLADAGVITVLIIWPEIATFLPNLMMKG